jgi:Zn-dependent protease
MKILNFGFIFFIPAFVETIGNVTVLQHTLIAVAGPLVNLTLFLTAIIILKTHKKLSLKMVNFLTLTKNINIFLFVFNMIPIPGFDGFSVFRGLWLMIGL